MIISFIYAENLGKWSKRSSCCCCKRKDPPTQSWNFQLPTWKWAREYHVEVSNLETRVENWNSNFCWDVYCTVLQWSKPTFLSLTTTSLNCQQKIIRYLILRMLWRTSFWDVKFTEAELVILKNTNFRISMQELFSACHGTIIAIDEMIGLRANPKMYTHSHCFSSISWGWAGHGSRQKCCSDAINLFLS